MTNLSNDKLLSIVVSVYNEESILNDFWALLEAETKKLKYRLEVIFVNDGSADRSKEILEVLAKNSIVKVLHFSRNFGHEAAMLAGVDHSRGDWVICLDADGQHPPTQIPEMLQKGEEGFEIVNMVRLSRADGSWLKKKLSKWFYKFLNRISPVRFHENASDFFMISSKVSEILRSDYRERARFIRGFIQSVGFESTTLTFDSGMRGAGESKYSLYKLVVLSMGAIVSFSKLPLHLGLFIGFLFGLLAVGLGVYSILMFIIDEVPSGYTTLVVFIALSFALVFFLIGIIGVYIGFMFEETKKRPIYILDK